MLSAIFSFRGRLGRLQYFGGSAALVGSVFVVVLVAVLSVGSLENLKEHPQSAAAPLILFLLALPAWIWVSLSLQARRIRDIGFDPLIVIPAFFVLTMLVQGLGAAVPSLRIVGSLISLAYDGCLLFWPGDGGAGLMTSEPSRTVRPTPTPVEAGAQRGQLMAPATMQPVEAGPPRFGRRGL